MSKNINQKEYMRKYRLNNLIKIKEIQKKSYLLHKEAYQIKSKKYRITNKETISQRMKIWYSNLKQKVFDHYGSCQCCGESNIRFLTIDHKDNDGAKHRKKIGSGGTIFYSWIIKNEFPSNLQSLCFNCNCSKNFSGICHKTNSSYLPSKSLFLES